MSSLLIWAVYGLFVGAIAKSIVPGEENFGFIKTIALGVAGSYFGGALSHILNVSEAFEPAGIFMGIVGAIVSLLVFNKLNTKK